MGFSDFILPSLIGMEKNVPVKAASMAAKAANASGCFTVYLFLVALATYPEDILTFAHIY